MSLRRTAKLVLGVVAAGAVLCGPGSTTSAGAADDIVDADCKTIDRTVEDEVVTRRPSQPLESMGVEDAQALLARRGQVAGQGVVVAVIDSGVAVTPDIPVVARRPVAGVFPPENYHGTAVAGLIAGQPRANLPVGVAPGAQILDVQIYDDPNADEDTGGIPVRPENVVAGLDQVIAALPELNIKVVNISLAITHTPAVRQRINRLWKAGVIVVAPTGNRPDEGGDENDALGPEFDSYQPGEDAAKAVHPASYPNVVAVNASMTGLDPDTSATAYVLQNSNTKVAAPTAGAVSYSVTGGTCLLPDPATSFAAAEVSGVLAMLQSVYDERPAQAVRRLLTTASGRPDIPNSLVGAGEVSAYAALTRPLTMDEEGGMDPTAAQGEPQRLAAPEDEPDLLAATRRNAVWWGLLCGGVLLLALVLRPVLARRRHSTTI